MKVKLFRFKHPYFSFSSMDEKLRAFETEMNHWFEQNSAIKVHHIKEQMISSFMEPPEVFISVWYEDDTQ